MHEEHRRGMRDEGWGPSSRRGGPEWGPRSGRGPERGRRGGDWGERGERGGPGWGGHGGRGPGGPGGRRWGRAETMGMPPFPPFPPMGPMGGPMFVGRHPFGRGMRARKGDVRAVILDLLAEGGQWNGYQLIREIDGRTSGMWRPSAGSVYPALQQLEDEGLIRPEGEGRRRMYTLTDAGSAYAESHADELSASWDAVAGVPDDADVELGDLIRQVMMAVMEVRRAGSADQLAEARRVLSKARRALYQILAEGEDEDAAAEPGGQPGADPGPEEPDDAAEGN